MRFFATLAALALTLGWADWARGEKPSHSPGAPIPAAAPRQATSTEANDLEPKIADTPGLEEELPDCMIDPTPAHEHSRLGTAYNRFCQGFVAFLGYDAWRGVSDDSWE